MLRLEASITSYMCHFINSSSRLLKTLDLLDSELYRIRIWNNGDFSIAAITNMTHCK